ncbi:LysR family transcriptional regulator [bacterium]|nr:LysR family transcriptional regulator [bacterium]
MTIKQLELFIALAETPHLGKVSQEKHLSQSAISTAIKNLEEILETKLFDRSNKKIILNEDGRLFLRRVEPLVTQLQWCENIFRDAHLHGSLNIGVSSTIAKSILPRMLYRFIELHEGVTFRTETGNTQTVVNLIEKGGVDIGFIEGEYHCVDIQKEVFGTDELYIVTGDKKLADKKAYRMEELLQKRWILREKGSGTREVFLRHLGAHTQNLNVFMQIDNTGGVKSVLRNSDTLACMSRYHVKFELEHGSLYRVRVKDMSFTRPFYLIWHRNKYISSLLNEFMNFSRSWDEIA